MVRFDRLMAAVVRGFSLVGGAALVAIMLGTTADVVLRSLVGIVLFGIQELIELGLVAVAVLGMAHCAWTRRHIAVDLLTSALPARVSRVLDVAVLLLSAVVIGLFAWYSIVEGIGVRASDAHTNMLSIAKFPFYWVAGAGFGAYALVLIVQALRGGATPPHDEADL